MTGLPLEYAQARVGVRYGARADEAVWNQIAGARSLTALLETARASPLKEWVAAIPADADADEIELRLRIELRRRIVEVAQWLPRAWRSAVLWTAHLVDLPAVERLAGGEAPAAWMRRDPALQPYADPDPDVRRNALRAGALAEVVRALDARAGEGSGLRSARASARQAWLAAWRSHWPQDDAEHSRSLAALVALVESHLEGFVEHPVADDPWSLRRGLAQRLQLRFRRYAFTPAAVFAYLALVALDVERLRGQLVLRAAFDRPQ